MKEMFYHLGYYGPLYLFVLAGLVWVAQFPRHVFSAMALYLAFQLVAHFANKVLKAIFHQPRPVELAKDKTDKWDRYGMPSGHMQAIASQAALIAMVARQNPRYDIVALMAITWACITGWQRVDDRRHSLAQVVVGAVVGTILAVAFAKVAL